MKYIINQYQGLGDVFFCEPIARHLFNNGENEIVWPILDDYIWIKKYIPYINFVKKSEFNFNYESTYFGKLDETTTHVPLRFANPIFRGLHPHDYSDQYHTMLDKYRMMRLPEDMWRTFSWVRDEEKENELYNSLIKNNNYVLVNNFWSDGILDINFETNGRDIVHMNKINGFTLFDWSKVIENADEIHTVSTSNLYIIESLKLKTENVYIYPRKPRENNFDGILEFVNKKFKLIL
jgi:hypothetical protein